MMRKILVVGMILLLSSACLPQRGSISGKNYSQPSSTMEERSLFNQTESEKYSPQEIPPSSKESSPSDSSSSTGNQLVWSLEFPISDESNDNFSLEVLPKDRPKQAQEFDIPIVINAKVEQFIQYFVNSQKSSVW